MYKDELKKVECKIKTHKVNKSKLAIIQFEIDDIQDEIDTYGFDEKLNNEIIRLKKVKKNLNREVNRIEKALELLDKQYRQLVYLRYFDNQPWRVIESIMCIDHMYLCNSMRYDALNIMYPIVCA